MIDAPAFNRIKSYLEHARSSPDIDVIAGGKCDDSVGYYVDPTILVTKNPHEKVMEEVSTMILFDEQTINRFLFFY